MPRIFTFGCSFTQYMWPTWATIISYDLNIPLYNFGIAGLGNVGIMHRIFEADIKFNFKSDDIIMILWTSWSRDDHFINYGWQSVGSRFNNFTPKSLRQLKNNWTPDSDIIKNATAISYVNKAYGNQIYWQGSAFDVLKSETMHEEILDFFINKKNKKHYELFCKHYQNNLPKLPIINFEAKDLAFNLLNDTHPDVVGHLNRVNDFIYPCINRKLKSSTIAIFENIHEQIKSELSLIPKVSKVPLHSIQNIISPIIEKNIDTERFMSFKFLSYFS